MADWVKRVFTSAGVTQLPAGPGIRLVQRRVGGGVAMLVIDISGSMQGISADGSGYHSFFGMPVQQAFMGAKKFVDEAVDAAYEVGVILWNTGVAVECQPAPSGQPAYEILNRTSVPPGGTDLHPALLRTYDILRDYTGDRVVAIFGDGDLGTAHRVLPLVKQMKRDNIRFVTRGLGAQAAEAFGKITDEAPAKARVKSVEELADSIADMATALKDGALRAQDG